MERGDGPSRILLEEERGAAWVERVPHERVVAESKDEEVAGREGLEHVEGSPDFSLGLLREVTRRRVVEDGDEGGGSGVKLGGNGGLGCREGLRCGAGGGRVEHYAAEVEEEDDGCGGGGGEDVEEAWVGSGRVFLLVGRLMRCLHDQGLHVN